MIETAVLAITVTVVVVLVEAVEKVGVVSYVWHVLRVEALLAVHSQDMRTHKSVQSCHR